jgi:hypothetical protein
MVKLLSLGYGNSTRTLPQEHRDEIMTWLVESAVVVVVVVGIVREESGKPNGAIRAALRKL